MVNLAILMPIPAEGPPAHPAQSPHGRAALALRDEGVRVVVTEHLSAGLVRGFEATDAGWRVRMAQVSGVYDAWPDVPDRVEWEAAVSSAGERVIGNPPELTRALGERLTLQRTLELSGVPVLPIEAHSAHFSRALKDWGAVWVEIRGPGGASPRVVVDPVDLPSNDTSLVRRHVAPPAGWSEASLSCTVQRDPVGAWVVTPAVLRRVTRGRVVMDVAEDILQGSALQHTKRVALQVAEALVDEPSALELGLRFALDARWRPHLLRVESSSTWDLLALERAQPGRWEVQVTEALCRPFHRLAALL